MEAPFTTYQRLLAQTRLQYLQRGGVLEEVERAFYRVFALMLLDLQKDAQRGTVTAERAELLRHLIYGRLNDLSRRLQAHLTGGDGHTGSLQLVAKLVGAGHAEAFAAYAAEQAVAIEVGFQGIPRRALALMIARSQGQGLSATFQTLIQRRIGSLAGDVDDFLLSAVGRGVTWQQSTTELAKILSRDNVNVLKALEHLGPRGGRLRTAMARTADIPELVMREAKQLLHASRRIMVNETNQAYHAADLVASAESPAIALVQWTLSAGHPSLPSSPDVCDIVAQHDAGYGPGRYRPEVCPSLLHPFCQCLPRKVFRAVAEWDDPKPPIVEPRLVIQAYAQAVLTRNTVATSRPITTASIEAQTKRANLLIESAFSSYQSLVTA